MSSMMNKIADALTGHHTTNAAHPNAAHPTTGAAPLANQTGAVGTGFTGSNYSAQNNGALKEGAQVRDTGLAATKDQTHTAAYDSYNHTKPTTGMGMGAAAATGAALGSATHHDSHSHHTTGTDMTGSHHTTGMHTTGATTTGMHSTGMHTTGAHTGMATGMHTGAVAEHDNAMTRSEEHLLVGKEKVNVGKAVLNKYVTTEKVSTAVPIVREHAVIEREPITDANRSAALSGPDFKEARYEVNLMEERAVAEKEVVPIERVRLRKEVEQTQQYVEAELRKEHIELIDQTQAGKQLGTVSAAGAGLGRDAAMNTSTTMNTSSQQRSL